MKHFILIILMFIQYSFSGFSQLNKQINKSQMASLKISPFETATSMTYQLNIQKKYRNKYIVDLDGLIQKFPNDTIILSEFYDFICFGCPATNVRILADTLLINYERDFKSKEYKKSIEAVSKKSFNQKSLESDLFELRNEIWTNNNWNGKPEKYGTDECFDGGHTLFTVIYPNGNLISMYMRCWIPERLREKDNF